MKKTVLKNQLKRYFDQRYHFEDIRHGTKYIHIYILYYYFRWDIKYYYIKSFYFNIFVGI